VRPRNHLRLESILSAFCAIFFSSVNPWLSQELSISCSFKDMMKSSLRKLVGGPISMILIGSPGWKDDLAHLNIGGKQNIPNVFVEDWLSVEETIGSNKMYLMVRRTVGPHSKSIVEDTARSR